MLALRKPQIKESISSSSRDITPTIFHTHANDKNKIITTHDSSFQLYLIIKKLAVNVPRNN